MPIIGNFSNYKIESCMHTYASQIKICYVSCILMICYLLSTFYFKPFFNFKFFLAHYAKIFAFISYLGIERVHSFHINNRVQEAMVYSHV